MDKGEDVMTNMCDEATSFACELLMPKESFDKYINEKSNNVSDIAAHFQVPSMAVRIRANQLGYTGHELRSEFLKRFKQL